MDLSFFKRHPVVTAGVVVIGGIVFFTIFNGGGGGGSSASAAPQGISAADQQYRLAQLSANVQGQGFEAQLEQMRIQSETAIELASFQHNIEGLKLGLQETLGLAALASQDKMTEAQLEAVKVNNQYALQAHSLDLANASEARQQQIQLSALENARQSEREAWQYTLNYQQNQQNYDIQQQLVAALKDKVA